MLVLPPLALIVKTPVFDLVTAPLLVVNCTVPPDSIMSDCPLIVTVPPEMVPLNTQVPTISPLLAPLVATAQVLPVRQDHDSVENVPENVKPFNSPPEPPAVSVTVRVPPTSVDTSPVVGRSVGVTEVIEELTVLCKTPLVRVSVPAHSGLPVTPQLNPVPNPVALVSSDPVRERTVSPAFDVNVPSLFPRAIVICAAQIRGMQSVTMAMTKLFASFIGASHSIRTKASCAK